LPNQLLSWVDEDKRPVEYYPFLVIISGIVERNVWLPYFHVITDGGRKIVRWGQFAPYMPLSAFADLVRQARLKGFQV
jgi:hypothetical protein